MKKYGGPGKKKKACEKRECTRSQIIISIETPCIINVNFRLQTPLTDISNQVNLFTFIKYK